MARRWNVFVDTDVIISSLISQNGAAYILLKSGTIPCDFWVSNYSKREGVVVADKLKLEKFQLINLLKSLKSVNIRYQASEIKKELQACVMDPNDTHIIKGAILSKSRFLITYNTKHYKIDKVKSDYGIIIMPPGKFLQFLRSN